jgi:hypothetical protein
MIFPGEAVVFPEGRGDDIITTGVVDRLYKRGQVKVY